MENNELKKLIMDYLDKYQSVDKNENNTLHSDDSTKIFKLSKKIFFNLIPIEKFILFYQLKKIEDSFKITHYCKNHNFYNINKMIFIMSEIIIPESEIKKIKDNRQNYCKKIFIIDLNFKKIIFFDEGIQYKILSDRFNFLVSNEISQDLIKEFEIFLGITIDAIFKNIH